MKSSHSLFTAVVLLAVLLSAGTASGQRRAPPTPEQLAAMRAIDVQRQQLGLPLATTPPAPRDCSVEMSCPNGTKVSCSASGAFTDCGGKYNSGGKLSGVACFTYKSTNPNEGSVSVNQSGCN